MHSIAAVRSAGGAADYFANDNYYTGEENAEAGVWAGEGARAIGLEGSVERDAFEARNHEGIRPVPSCTIIISIEFFPAVPATAIAMRKCRYTEHYPD